MAEDYISSRVKQLRQERNERQSTRSTQTNPLGQSARTVPTTPQRQTVRTETSSDDYISNRVKQLRQEREQRAEERLDLTRQETDSEESGGLLGGLMRVMQRNTEINNSRAYRTEEIRQEAEDYLNRGNAEREARYNDYNTWVEQGDNRDLAAAVRRVQGTGGMYSLEDLAGNNDRGWTLEQVEDAARRVEDYDDLGLYTTTHRIASSAEGIGSQAAGAIALVPETIAQSAWNIGNRRELNQQGDAALYNAVERVRNSNGMYTLEDLARNNDRGWMMEDITAAAAQLDAAAAPVSSESLGNLLYQQGEEALQEARLGLSDTQEFWYGAAESAGENILLGAVSPALLLTEQSLRSAGGGIADSAAAGQSAGTALASGLLHGAVSAGVEQLGIGQMARNMGQATGMSRVADSLLDRIADTPLMTQLGQRASWLPGLVANTGEEAAEEFVQTYLDAGVDALLGNPTPDDLLGEALQSALGGAAGGALIGGASTAIGGLGQMQQRIAPRADLQANANLSAAIERAGQVGQAQQAAGAAQMQQTAPEAAAETETTTPPNEGGLLDALADILPDGEAEGGRLDAAAWERLRGQGEQFAGAGNMVQAAGETSTAMRPTPAADPETLAARQAWDQDQRTEARLLAENTRMSEAAVDVAVNAMPEGVSTDVYSRAANSVYQMARQGITQDVNDAMEMARRGGVLVNQVLAAPGGENALRQVFNQGRIEGLEADGYSRAGLADTGRAGAAEYEPGALIPQEDRALIDLFAAASDTAVTVRQKLENDAGGYVDTALGKIMFGAEAGADTFGTILHESNHWYNAWDKAGGRQLQNELVRYLAEQQGFESVDALAESYIQRYQDAGQALSYAQACEEIASDALRGVFDSEESFGRWVEHQRAQAEQNSRQRGTVAKIMDAVREMLDKVIAKAKSILSRTPDNQSAQRAQRLAESQKRALEELYYQHMETAMEAERAARRSQNGAENVNESEESANENQTDVASSQQNVASEGENVASEGGNVASERRYQLPEDTGIRTVKYSDYADTTQENQDIAEREGLGEFGKSSPNGELKTAILYHGSYADFDEFDFELGRAARKSGKVDQYGEGFYFTENPEWARNYGDNVYKVEVKYSTDNRTAKRTGRERDFTRTSSGYWVIPPNKVDNIKILSKADASEAGVENMAKRYQLPVDEGRMESGQRAADWENVDRAGVIEALMEAYSEKETRRVPIENIQRMTSRLIAGEQSKANRVTVAKQLESLAEYMASGQADYDAAIAAAEGVADEIMQRSGRIDRSLWNEYKDLHYFTVKVERGGPEYQELVYRYGNYAAAKRELARFGITLNSSKKSNARGIDQVYQELAGDYPGLFSGSITDAMEQLDRIAQVRQAIRPAYQNSYGESYDEARTDLALRIVGGLVSEGVTDQGVAGMLRQRIDENLNAHRAGVQRRVVNALNEQERTARDDAFRQMQRVVSASGEANRRRLEAEREAWAKTSDQMRTAMARSRNAAQRARDARNKDNVRRAIAANMKTLNRMVFHPNRQNHLSKKLLPDAVRMIEMLNSVTGSADNLTKADGLLAQLNREAKADNGVGGIATDWENSGIFNMMDGLLGDIRERQARMEARAEGHARRLEKSQADWYDASTEFESLYEDYQGAPRRGSQQVHRMTGLTLDEMVELRDISSALITLARNQNKLLAVQTQQAASEIGAQAKREVEENPFKLKDNSGKLAELKKMWDANVLNAERMFEMLGGYQHEGGALEALGKSLAEGEAKKNAIIQEGVQMLGNVLEGKENRKKLREFSGVDAPLYDFGLRYVDTGEAAKINLAQAATLYKNLQNMQNMYHVTEGGVVIPDMKDYTAGKMKRAFRLKRLAKMENPSETIRKLQEFLSKDEYFKKWIDGSGQILNVYTKGVINGVSVQMDGYEKAKVNDYFPIATDPDALEHQNTGTVYNGTIEGRGFLKERRNRSATPVLLEEIDRVVMRSLSDAAAYGGLAMPVRDANKILNANIYEGGSLMKAIKDNFGEDAVKFIDDYLSDLQGQPRTRKSMFEFLDGLRGNYARAVLTLNLSTIAGQVSGVPAMASELGYGSMGRAWKEMPHILADKKLRENLRKEMTEHGYWQLESTLSTGATAELAELRKKRGAVSWLAEHTPGVNALEWMDEGTRLVGWLGAKDYVDHNLAEYGLTEADVQGEKRSDAWWNAVASKMTEVNNRTQPNYTVSQMAAIQRNPNQLTKILTMFRGQTFQNYGTVVSAINDVRAQLAYIKDYTQKLKDANLGTEERQQLQGNLERVQKNKDAAFVRLGRAAGSQSLSALVFIAAGILVRDLFFHKYDRWKDENGEITPQSAASYAFMQWLTNMIEIIPFADTVTSLAANAVSGGQNDPISLSGIDSIGDASLDVYRFITAIQNEDRESGDEAEREAYWQNFYKRAWDASGSMLVLFGVPWGQVQRALEAGYGWWSDLAAEKNSDGLNLWDVMNAPPSSTSQYDRLYTAVFEEPDAEDAAAALKRLADLDKLTPPAKASDAKAGDSKLLTELLKREREYGSSVQDAAAARVAGNEAQQRQIRQELVNTLADALGIDQSTKEGQRRLRTVINKVDSAITDEVREQMGADSKTGATVYTPLLTALEDGGDLTAAQTVLRRAGITDSNIKSAVQSVYKDEYLWADDAGRQEIETKLLRLKDAYGEPYFTKTKDQDDFADWVTDWTLQGLNDSVYTDLDEALLTEDRAAAQQEINRYMEAGKEIGSIRNRVSSLYKREYQNADAARRRELGRFLAGLVAGGEQVVTTDTLLDWIKESYR